jgi:hypothetical protein
MRPAGVGTGPRWDPIVGRIPNAAARTHVAATRTSVLTRLDFTFRPGPFGRRGSRDTGSIFDRHITIGRQTMASKVPEQRTPEVPGESVAQVEERIRGRLGGQVSDLRLVVRDEGVVLQGRSRTHHARQLAQQLVMDCTELRILANEIRV